MCFPGGVVAIWGQQMGPRSPGPMRAGVSAGSHPWLFSLSLREAPRPWAVMGGDRAFPSKVSPVRRQPDLVRDEAEPRPNIWYAFAEIQTRQFRNVQLHAERWSGLCLYYIMLHSYLGEKLHHRSLWRHESSRYNPSLPRRWQPLDVHVRHGKTSWWVMLGLQKAGRGCKETFLLQPVFVGLWCLMRSHWGGATGQVQMGPGWLQTWSTCQHWVSIYFNYCIESRKHFKSAFGFWAPRIPRRSYREILVYWQEMI